MTIGIYCGSFDPVHNGHVMLASHIAASGAVDEVWLLVSRINPLKEGIIRPASGEERLEMCRLAVADCPNLRADGTELGLPSPSYTYRTLCHLRDTYPQHQFRLIVGSDNIEVFDRWRNADRILSEFGVLVYPRPGHIPSGGLPEGAEWIEGCPVSDASSTRVRERIARELTTDGLLDAAVAAYIAERRLYQN